MFCNNQLDASNFAVLAYTLAAPSFALQHRSVAIRPLKKGTGSTEVLRVRTVLQHYSFTLPGGRLYP